MAKMLQWAEVIYAANEDPKRHRQSPGVAYNIWIVMQPENQQAVIESPRSTMLINLYTF